MSSLLQGLGRGLVADLLNVFERQLPHSTDSAAELTQRTRTCPTSADLAVQLGAAHLRADRPQRAAQSFARALELGGAMQAARLGLACALDALDDLAGAASILEQAHEADPDDPAVAFGLGLCRERIGEPAPAATAYEAALARCVTLRNAHERLAAMAISRGQFETAADIYTRLAGLDPGDLDVLLILGAVQLRAGAFGEAIQTYQRTLLVEPEACEPAGTVLDQAPESEDEALAFTHVLEQLIEQQPAVTEYRVHLADLYVKLGEDALAVEQYNAALDLHPTLLEATVKLGTQHLRRQRHMQAARAFNRALALNDRLLAAFAGLGVAQASAGSDADAQASFDLVASLAPNSTLLFAETARLRARALAAVDGDAAPAAEPTSQEDALERIARQIAHAAGQWNNHPGLHYQHGLLLRYLGAFHDSVDAHARAVEIDPCLARAQIQLGVGLREIGEGDASQACMRRAVLGEQADLTGYYELALTFTRRRRFDATLEVLASEADDDDAQHCFEAALVTMLESLGLLDQAESSWQSLSEFDTPLITLQDGQRTDMRRTLDQ